MKSRIATAAIAVQLLSVAPSLHAATVATSAGDEQAKLAMQLNNPVAALISVPLQSNWDFGIGPGDAYQYKLNVQPVIPITLNEDWNLISRTILPVIDAESPAPGIDDVSGLGNTTQSFFLSPQQPTDGIIWGVGPVILIPTATDDLLGANQWGAGPTVVALKQTDGWTYGALANQLWSFAGGNDATNATYLQPFVSYTTKTHTTFLLNSESTYNWQDSQWSIPLNLAVAQLVKIGELPVQFQLGGRVYADGPDDGPNWGMRFTVTFLFPEELASECHDSMRNLLPLAAVGEIATGFALLVAPSLVGRLLLGGELTGGAIPVARVLGIALIGLGVTCWPGTPRAGMVTYGAGVTLYLAFFGITGGGGVLLWPAVVLHAALTVLLVVKRGTKKRQHQNPG